MKVRTYLGILAGFLVVVFASYFTSLNRELLTQGFHIGPETRVPLYAAMLIVVLAGFLPAATVLVLQSLRRDLSERRRRRRHREAESLSQHFRRAVDHQVDHQWGKAAAELEHVLTERPEDFASLLRYGEVLRSRGEAERALEVHRRASVLYPQSIALLYQLAEDYEALDDRQVAHEIRNRILRDFPGQGIEVMRRRRDMALAGRDWEVAVRWNERVESFLEESGEEAGRERESGIARGLTYQRGVSLLESDRPSEAAQIFRKLLKTEPRFIPAWIMVGEAELLQGRDELALDEWRQGFRTTGSPVFLQRIEDHFIEAAEPARAIETLRALMARAKNDLLLRFFLGRLYYRLEMHDEALKVLGSISEAMDASPTYHYLLARIHQRRDDQIASLTHYLECLHRAGLPEADFVCRSCRARSSEWHDRCESCGTWNSVELDFYDEKLSEEELGVVERPVWGGYGPLEDTQTIEVQGA